MSKSRLEALVAWFYSLCDRLHRVRICCGDWTRVLGESVTTKHGITGMVFDPPYNPDGRDARCYIHDDGVWDQVWPWALEHGANPQLRIVLCGYEGEWGKHLVSAGWDEHAWKTQGGYGAGMGGRGEANRSRERLWFSPACLRPDHMPGDVPGQMLLGGL